jgi:F420-non-reducing hydrogenase iron-sulfur subunit
VQEVGIDPDRVEMFNLSAAEGPRWAEICNLFTERTRKLGPSPVRIAKEEKAAKKRSEQK